MRVLVIGSGGREHALCWALAASPLLDTLWCAPGNPGTAQAARNVDIPVTDIAGLVRFAGDNRVGPRRPRPRGAAGGRPRRCAGGGRDRLLRAERRGGPARSEQELHQGAVRRRRDPHRALGAVRRPGGGARIRHPPGRADRGEGRRAGRRQGGGGGGDRGRGARRDRRARRAAGDRGGAGRRGGVVLRALRRHRCRSARRRAGPQAARRARHRSEYRRHGGLCAAADVHRRPGGGGDGVDRGARPWPRWRGAARRSAASCSPV